MDGPASPRTIRDGRTSQPSHANQAQARERSITLYRKRQPQAYVGTSRIARLQNEALDHQPTKNILWSILSPQESLRPRISTPGLHARTDPSKLKQTTCRSNAEHCHSLPTVDSLTPAPHQTRPPLIPCGPTYRNAVNSNANSPGSPLYMRTDVSLRLFRNAPTQRHKNQ
jgi:hypothetical protein